ncbi:pleckstrin homology domain-containing family M member 3-like [Penaeus indicus]|uniref:pleckstrin homology domain-containing family M member 3-like n=1 Tax=Penaeus indicus TaxID=29960 RepID=UPI00300C464E
MIYGKPRVCSYDSKYYCYECHEDEVCLIPARVVHNWDLAGHPVCKRNASWLSAVQHQPLINLRTVNPKLYCHIDDLAEMQMLRTQLLYVRAYLFTCKTGVGEELRKLLWPREHLYEHVHLYSVSDLQLVATGQLVQKVRQAVTFGRDHVAQCHVCSARGFICELCDDNDVIYPFQLGSTHTCGECYGVYHGLCARGRKDCPRCIRRRARRSQEGS